MPVLLPPPQYDHPYEHRLIVETLPYFEVDARCGKAFRARFEGCSWQFKDGMGNPTCHIIYPRLQDVNADVMVSLIRHETGHCVGWPADHPDGHYE